MARSALEPVSEAVYAALNVSGLTSLVGGLHESVPQSPTYPFVWWQLRETDTTGTFTQVFKTCDLSVHCFSTYQGSQEAQQVISKVVELLRGASLSPTAHTALIVTHEGTRAMADKRSASGELVKHLVAEFELLVSEN